MINNSQKTQKKEVAGCNQSIYQENNCSRIKAYLENDWSSVFRDVVFPVLPTWRVEKLFCPNNGRPCKDIAIMLGLTVIQEIFNLTDSDVIHRLITDMTFHNALHITNICDDTAYVSLRTYVSFRHKLMNNELGDDIFTDVTVKFAEQFEVNMEYQRLDSVHYGTNMKNVSRLSVMTSVVRKFVRKLERQGDETLMLLPDGITARYIPDKKGINYFGRVEPSKRDKALQTVAEDMYALINLFQSNQEVSDFFEFKLLVRVFGEQCIVKEKSISPKNVEEVDSTITVARHAVQKELEEASTASFVGDEVRSNESQSVGYSGGIVELKAPKDVPSDSVQSASDTEATYSGHKGKGRQAQIVETYSPSKDPDSKPNKVQLVTYVHSEGAHKSDAAAFQPAVEVLIERNMKPDYMATDTAYGSEENRMYAEERGIELIAPVPGGNAGKKNETKDAPAVPVEKLIDSAQSDSYTQEFVFENAIYQESSEVPDAVPILLSDFSSTKNGKILGCPMGQKTKKNIRNKNNDGGQAYFDRSACAACERRDDCLVKISTNIAKLSYRDEQVRIAKRRAYQLTDEFKDKYRWRSGIEGANSFLARLGIKRLRVRGDKASELKIKLKALGVNIRRVTRYVSRERKENGAIMTK